MRISKVARRARSAAEALKSTGMPHQEVSSTCFYCQSVQPWKQMIYKTHFVFSRQPSRIWVTSSRNCPRSPPSLSLKVLYWNHIPWVLPSILCSPRASDMVFESKPLQECKDFLTAEKAFVEARDHAVQYSRMLCFKYHYPLLVSKWHRSLWRPSKVLSLSRMLMTVVWGSIGKGSFGMKFP